MAAYFLVFCPFRVIYPTSLKHLQGDEVLATGVENYLDGMGYDAAATILVVADSADGRRIIESAADAVGARTLAAVSIGEAAAKLEELIGVTVVAVHAARSESRDNLTSLVRQLDEKAAEGLSRALVVVPHDMIDSVYSGIPNDQVDILCQPQEGDVVAALAMACTRRTLRLKDVSGDSSSLKLAQLSEEVGRIARTLANLAESAPQIARAELTEFPAPPPMTADVATAAAGEVRRLIRARRARNQFFRTELFADPAWDMLLDLMAARLEHKRVSVSSLCIAASVPATTALRWIKSLTEEGLFIRRADNSDGRRIFIELSERAAGAMNAYLEWLKANPALAV